MQQKYDLEIIILSCLLIKPELIENIKLKDEHFRKHKRLWVFMKTFYKKFGTFDVAMMFQICQDKYQIIKYIEWLCDCMEYCNTSNFDKYQDELIELCSEEKKERWIIEEVYEQANELVCRNISYTEFKQKILEIEAKANEIQ